MARSPVLGGASLNPFGGAGVDFGAFDITSSDREASLILTRVEVAWEAGTATDEEYLAALDVYAQAQTPNTSSRLNAEARVASMRYRVERNVLAAKVDDGSASVEDLLAFDRSKLVGLNQNSEEYRQRLNVMQSTQQRLFSETEQDIVQAYNDGHMTTAQLDAWYSAAADSDQYEGNKDLEEHVEDRRHDLANRLVEERDQKVMSDYQDGKITPASFMSYATNARARYVPDSADYKAWDERLTEAKDQAAETQLLYRYDLAQQYAQLSKFVQSNAGGPSGGSSGSAPRATYSTRTILGADGKWKTVKVQTGTTKGSAGSGPSAAEQAAWKNRQIEVADAKLQMKQIAAKMAKVGGAVTTKQVISYYTRQLGTVANGSQEWYAIQGHLDSLNERLHSETVLAKQGIKTSYPKSSGGGGGSSGGSSVGSSAAPSAGGSSGGGGSGSSPAATAKKKDNSLGDLDNFLQAIAHVESGGRYTARNKSSGAFGKYQVMPANWSGWAAKYLGNANAPQTPENQEKLVRAKMTDLYKWLGDWNAVAHWWLTGGSDGAKHQNPGSWSTSSTRYVNNVMAGMGRGPVSKSTLATEAQAKPTTAGSGSMAPKGAVPRTTGTTGAKPVLAVTGYQGQKLHSAATASTKAVALPSNDSEGFTKFYSQFASAFKSGETEFTINGVTYWVGDDPAERTDLMLSLDQLRVSMYDEKARAYAGKPSGITASNQADKAREDAAGNALRILNTNDAARSTWEIENGRQRPQGVVNPVSVGLEELARTTAGINAHVANFKTAYANGDLSTAYAEYQMAAALAARGGQTLGEISAYAENSAAAIERQFGVGRTEALGTTGANVLNKDLGDLGGWDSVLTEALNAGSVELTEFQQIVEKDSKGNLRYVDGEVFLDEKNYRYVLGANGKVKPEVIKKTAYDANGQPTVAKDDQLVRTRFYNGSNVVEAYSKYNVAQVGTFTDPTGKKIPIMGKSIEYLSPDGKRQLWVEDPFKPGTWSNKPIAYNTGASFKAIPGPAGSTVFQYRGEDGWTYTLAPDAGTGTYTAQRTKPGGIASGEQVEDLGSLGPLNPASEQFSGDGNTRIQGPMEDLWGTRMQMPAIGFTKQEYIGWASKNPITLPRQDRNVSQWDLAHHRGAVSSFGPGGKGKAEDDIVRLPPGRSGAGEPDWYARQVAQNKSKSPMTGFSGNIGKAGDDRIVIKKPIPKNQTTAALYGTSETRFKAPVTTKKTAKPATKAAPAKPIIRDPKETTPAKQRTTIKKLPVRQTSTVVKNRPIAL